MPETFVAAEISSQPRVWEEAARIAVSSVSDARASVVSAQADSNPKETIELHPGLPQPGERVAIVGCGTSWFMAMSYAATRESRGLGLTDAFVGSEFPYGRSYDRIIAITRSGTTTEIIDLLSTIRRKRSSTAPSRPQPELGLGSASESGLISGSDMNSGSEQTEPHPRLTVITAVADTPAPRLADDVIALPFADEQSVVQTRFATSALILLRAGLGEDTSLLIPQAQQALEIPVDNLLEAEQVSFIGMGAAVGLAFEAALKTREAAQFWAESYPAMDYRHGPIAIAQRGRLVWSLGSTPDGLREQVAASGARFVHHELDPVAGLIVAQRFAVGLALRRGLNPDRPRSLTRSVILP